MRILGLSGSTHDPAATVVIDGHVVAALEEERLCRRRHAPGELPVRAAQVVLQEAGLRPSDVDLVAFFFQPRGYAVRALRHAMFGDPRRYVLHGLRYRTREFVMRGVRYAREASKVVAALGMDAPIRFVPHHMAHAASTFLTSPFEEATILCADNMGELDASFLAFGRGKGIRRIGGGTIPHSLGMLYATATSYLGFRAWRDEGKVMGLAAYGSPSVPIGQILACQPSGRIRIRRPFQMVFTKNGQLYSPKLVTLLGPARQPHEEIQQHHKDVAASVQVAVEMALSHMLEWSVSVTGCRNICLAGGVALNCRANGVLARLPFVDDLHVVPAPGDGGTSMGAALLAGSLRGEPRVQLTRATLGPSYEEAEVEAAIGAAKLPASRSREIAHDAAHLVASESFIGWFQGRSEFGPRALGARSILALPSSVYVRDYINRKVKQREVWRPLCPVVLADQSDRYFERTGGGRYMNVAFRARRLARERLQGVVHADGTARVQEVDSEEQPVLASFLRELGRITGDPIALNTSLNCQGEPIVESPHDAVQAFLSLPLRKMVMNNLVVSKP